MTDLAALYKKRFEDLRGNIPGSVHSPKQGFSAEWIVESKRGKDTFLTFDTDLSEVLNEVYEKDFDEEAFVLSKAADILRTSLLKRESQGFSGQFDLDSQTSFFLQFLSSFVDMVLQGTNININKKYLEPSKFNNFSVDWAKYCETNKGQYKWKLLSKIQRIATRCLHGNDVARQNTEKGNHR